MPGDFVTAIGPEGYFGGGGAGAMRCAPGGDNIAGPGGAGGGGFGGSEPGPRSGQDGIANTGGWRWWWSQLWRICRARWSWYCYCPICQIIDSFTLTFTCIKTMVHFAQLDENNVVTQSIVVSDEDTSDYSGVKSESIGVAFCQKRFGANTNWKQTFYDGNTRFRYAGVGYSYNEELDAFVSPKPFPSWVLDNSTANWVSPIGSAPELTEEQIKTLVYRWSEDTQNWILEEDISVNT